MENGNGSGSLAVAEKPMAAEVEREAGVVAQLAAAKRQMGGISVYRQISDPVDFVKGVGAIISESQMFGCKKTEQGQIIALMLLTDQMSVRSFLQTFDLICDANKNANLSMNAGAMLAEFNNRGGVHKILATSPDVAAIKLTRADGESFEYMVKWADLEQEGFTKDRDGKTKGKYATPFSRSQMLWARCVSDAVRKFDPGVNFGTYTPEEIDDFMEVDDSPVSGSEPKRKPGRPKKEDQPAATHSTAAGGGAVASTAPAATAPVETSAPPAAGGTSPAPAAPVTPASTVAQQSTSPGPLPSESAFEQCARYKMVLTEAGKLDDAKWQMVLTKLECPVDPADGVKRKLSLATPAQHEQMATFLLAQIQKFQLQQQQSELSQWANGAAPAAGATGESAAAPGPQS